MPGHNCMSCGRDLPAEAKQCRRCGTTELFKNACTSEYRVAEYFAILKRFELWPSIDPFTTKSLSDIMHHFECAEMDHNHQCGANEGCPLLHELVHLYHLTLEALDDIEGISLEEIGVS